MFFICASPLHILNGLLYFKKPVLDVLYRFSRANVRRLSCHCTLEYSLFLGNPGAFECTLTLRYHLLTWTIVQQLPSEASRMFLGFHSCNSQRADYVSKNYVTTFNGIIPTRKFFEVRTSKKIIKASLLFNS